jgi:hypothetical protein
MQIVCAVQSLVAAVRRRVRIQLDPEAAGGTHDGQAVAPPTTL